MQSSTFLYYSRRAKLSFQKKTNKKKEALQSYMFFIFCANICAFIASKNIMLFRNSAEIMNAHRSGTVERNSFYNAM